MELKNEFHVSVPIDVAWAVLTDLERVAPCMPGAELQEVEGDEYRGIVKVKVGPITAQYKGSARFVEKDDEQHRAVLLAEGRDTRGQGNASATVTAIATPDRRRHDRLHRDGTLHHREGGPVWSERHGRRQRQDAGGVRRQTRGGRPVAGSRVGTGRTGDRGCGREQGDR